MIAPENSNNAKEGGSLVPTLLFGVPGSGTTAVLLGGMVLIGLQPGPTMLTTNLDSTLTVIWTLAIANVFGTLACMAPSRLIARVSLIPAAKLAPFILVILVAGAYQSTRDWGDLVAFVALGLLGWVMRHMGWPRPPLLIGFVLSISAERYLWISATRYGWSWLASPGVIAIGILTIALTYGSARLRKGMAVDTEART